MRPLTAVTKNLNGTSLVFQLKLAKENDFTELFLQSKVNLKPSKSGRYETKYLFSALVKFHSHSVFYSRAR